MLVAFDLDHSWNFKSKMLVFCFLCYFNTVTDRLISSNHWHGLNSQVERWLMQA